MEKSPRNIDGEDNTSIITDLMKVEDKLKGQSKDLLKEMITTAERNPDEQTRAIERLLQEKIYSLNATLEEVDR